VSSLARAIRLIRQQHSKTRRSLPVPDEPVPQEVQPLVDEIHQLVEELSAAHRSNQRFVGNTAHQLRTPLAAMRVQLESARRLHDADHYGKAVDHAVPELARLSHLLHQLLTLARVDEDHAGIVAGADLVDLATLARQVVERHFDQALELGVDIGYDGPAHGVMVEGKDALLREVLNNLLDNALRYGAKAGGQITVSVRTNPAELTVEDEGPGIPEAERDRVRERYYRMPGSDSEGSGLGLAIVDEVAQRHGAVFTLEPGKGGVGVHARFRFPPRRGAFTAR
jgi:two-component system sensor histidine kinase TctE